MNPTEKFARRNLAINEGFSTVRTIPLISQSYDPNRMSSALGSGLFNLNMVIESSNIVVQLLILTIQGVVNK